MRQKLEQLFLCFMLYSFLGWCYEVFLEVVVYRWGYSDRGGAGGALLRGLWLWGAADHWLSERP